MNALYDIKLMPYTYIFRTFRFFQIVWDICVKSSNIQSFISVMANWTPNRMTLLYVVTINSGEHAKKQTIKIYSEKN
jgi:hypothetical protein